VAGWGTRLPTIAQFTYEVLYFVLRRDTGTGISFILGLWALWVSRYEVDFSCPTHICKPLAWDAAKLFTESGNHSHASGDGKIQPPPREHVCFWAYDRRCPLITRAGRRNFQNWWSQYALERGGPYFGQIPGTVRSIAGGKPPKWVFGSLCNPTVQSSISFKLFDELDRHGSAVLRH
jgi:hypothetical protein